MTKDSGYLSSLIASVSASKDSKEQEQKDEYNAILVIFKHLLQSVSVNDEPWDVLESLMELRAEFAINHAIKGFGMDYESALELLRNFNTGLSKLDQDQRDRLVAAVDNLVDFAVAEEYQMFDSLPDDIDEEALEDEHLLEEYEGICHKYNYTFANVENGDIEFAMSIAAMWVRLADQTYLTYMTMGDERVRPWHLALEGETYSKEEFPSWMIPPIEHSCRCFLITTNDVRSLMDFDVRAQMKKMPSFVDPTFKESVAKCGRIFSDEHPYFQIPIQYKERLQNIADKIKEKYYANNNS